jgi:hypothetical protein
LPITRSRLRAAALYVVAVGCLVSGGILLPLPIPLGLPLIFIGVCLILSVSHVARNLFRRSRRRWPRLDDTVRGVQERVPERLRELLHSTDPHLVDCEAA